MGRCALEYLSRFQISCIVDSDVKLHGVSYKGITIISPEDFLRSEWKKYPVLVTPGACGNDIMDWLRSNGVFLCFLYSDCKYLFIPYARQVERSFLKTLIGDSSHVYIYGFNFLALLVVADLISLGIGCSFFLDRHDCDFFEKCFSSEMYHIDSLSLNEDCVSLLYVKKNRGDVLSLIDSKAVSQFDLYNLTLKKELFKNNSLECFKNCHKNERCFIIGNGPSLTISDLDVLATNKEVCFGVNGVYRAFDRTVWRPTYFCVSDVFFYTNNQLVTHNMESKAVFVSDDAIGCFHGEIPQNLYVCHKFLTGESNVRFSNDCSYGVYDGATVLYELCLQFAVYMGFSNIYIIGADCCNDVSGLRHFYDKGLKNSFVLNMDRVFTAYQAARQYADAHGIHIYNATRGGKLEVFPRVDFDSLF